MQTTTTETATETTSATVDGDNLADGSLRRDTAARIALLSDPDKHAEQVCLEGTPGRPAPFAFCSRDVMQDYCQARMSAPEGVLGDAHVHPALVGAAKLVLHKCSSMRTHEQDRYGNYRPLDRQDEMRPMAVGAKRRVRFGSSFVVKDQETYKRYAMYVHSCLLRLNPELGTPATLVPEPKGGAIGMVELPENEAQMHRRLKELDLLHSSEHLGFDPDDGDIS